MDDGQRSINSRRVTADPTTDDPGPPKRRRRGPSATRPGNPPRAGERPRAPPGPAPRPCRRRRRACRPSPGPGGVVRVGRWRRWCCACLPICQPPLVSLSLSLSVSVRLSVSLSVSPFSPPCFCESNYPLPRLPRSHRALQIEQHPFAAMWRNTCLLIVCLELRRGRTSIDELYKGCPALITGHKHTSLSPTVILTVTSFWQIGGSRGRRRRRRSGRGGVKTFVRHCGGGRRQTRLRRTGFRGTRRHRLRPRPQVPPCRPLVV